MQKKILVFSNGEKIGDGIIKLPLLNEIKRRLPNHKLYWMTDKGSTVYNNELKNIANKFIDTIFEKANLNPFFYKKISNIYDLKNENFEYILDTQKAVLRTISLKRINCSLFVSACASGYFSTVKITNNYEKKRKYYLENLFDLLDLIKKDKVDENFKFPLSKSLEDKMQNILKKENSYIGIAPGAGEKDKIWSIDNFIEVSKFFENKSFKLVFFLGPLEQNIKKKIKDIFPNSIILEDIIKDFSGPEVVMTSTKFLSCALTNDSGVSHMLSTNYCPLVKLFGPKDSDKFTPKNKKIFSINASDFGSNSINNIPSKIVIDKMENLIK